MASAELYDPVTNIWTQLPDLPFPLNSARMEIVGPSLRTTILGPGRRWWGAGGGQPKPCSDQCLKWLWAEGLADCGGHFDVLIHVLIRGMEFCSECWTSY